MVPGVTWPVAPFWPVEAWVVGGVLVGVVVVVEEVVVVVVAPVFGCSRRFYKHKRGFK